VSELDYEAFVAEGEELARRIAADPGPISDNGDPGPEALHVAESQEEREPGPEKHAEEPERSTWAPVDLGPVLASDEPLEPPPSILARTDDVRLIYAAKSHLVFGEPEVGKGWLVAAAVKERLEAGEHVGYIDFDDQDPRVMVARLRSLGVADDTIAEQFHYVIPDEPLTDAGRAEIERMLVEWAPSLVVLDGFTDALTLHNVPEGDNVAIAKWMRGLPARLKRAGAAVVLIDHVVKSREHRGGYSIGGQHKKAKVDVAYEVEAKKPLGRGLTGLALVKVRKDRPGHVRRHGVGDQVVAQMFAESLPGDAMDLALTPPRKGEFRPTGYMERVSKAVEAEPKIGVGDLRGEVTGSKDMIDLARERLRNEGYIDYPDVKAGASCPHTSIRPYREADDEDAE
jgi:hypothetical protein